MIHPNIQFWRAVGMLIGAIVGVGVFGLPYAFAQSGFVVGALVLVVLAGFMAAMQLMFTEVVLQTPGKHRVVGYIRYYLGQRAAWLGLIAFALSTWGALLAYLLVGGKFLNTFLSPVFHGSEFVYSCLLFVVAAYFIFRGLKFASKLEIGIIIVLLTLFLFIIATALPHVQISNLAGVNFKEIFVPYGVILFALGGIGIIPDMKDVLGKKVKQLPHAVMIGLVVTTLLYFLFPFVIVGVTGAGTTGAAFDGLIPVLGGAFGSVASLLGSLTIFSIFMVLGIELLNSFKYDFKLHHITAWLLVVGVPFILFLAGIRDFISVISVVGVFLLQHLELCMF
ncbi:MAG: aromatic amino acid transport family protein [Patescibacteria group bacterium]